MPKASGMVESASRFSPSQCPMAKAMSIITRPLMAEAVPAAWGKGAMALLCPQGM
jgi:hypothetical protein